MRMSVQQIAAVIAILTMSASAKAQSSDHSEDEPKSLFVQHADSAILSDGKLILDGVNNHLIMFADRPFRAASFIATQDLIEIWTIGKDSFKVDPPNAAVVGEADGKPTTLIVEITNPELSGDTLTFNYSLIEGQDPATLEKSYMIIDETLLGDLGSVSAAVFGAETGVTELYGDGILSPN